MITPFTFAGDDAALVKAVQAGHAGAAAALYDRYAKRVRAVLRVAIGPDQDLSDLIHDVFIVAFERIGTLQDVDDLSKWLAAIAVFVGRAHVRRRSRRSWLGLFSPEQTRVRQDEQPPSDTRLALREVYAILDRMPVDQRMAFLFRFAHGMSVPDAARTCGTSVSTFKRRLDRATKEFLQAARARPSLLQCLRDGTRWNQETQK